MNKQTVLIPVRGRLRRGMWLGLTLLSVGTGAIGLVLPLLPTTPFLLLAAWAAPKASPGLHGWLYNHPSFGATLNAWREEGAVPLAAKVTAGATLVLSWSLLFWLEAAALLLWITGFFFVAVLAFLLSRPNPRGNRL